MSLSKIYNHLQQKKQGIRRKLTPGALILMYHRITRVDSDPWSLCVTPKHFAEHLEVLQKYRYPIHLQQLTKTLQNRRPIQRSVVITFDDGYADNIYHAKPLLEKYGFPATVFITTSGMKSQEEFWWDELDRLLLQPGQLPTALHLKIQGRPFHWELGEASTYSESDHLKHYCWRMEAAAPTPRHELYRSLYGALRAVSSQEREGLLHELRSWANTVSVGRESHRSLSHIEVQDLERGGLVEVGAHTVSHPFLSQLSIDAQRNEIHQSKQELEETLGHPVSSFSYPNGSYALETISLVQEAGFSCACSSVADRVQRDSHRFLLPRVVVQDWDGEIFERWILEWL